MTVDQEISEAILNWGRSMSPVTAACAAMRDWHNHWMEHNRCNDRCSVHAGLWADWKQKFHLFYVAQGWA